MFLLLAAFAVALFEGFGPLFCVSEAAGAGAAPKTVNLLFIRASHLPTATGLGQFYDADCFLCWDFTGFRVTLGFIAMSAARSACFGALLR